VSGLSHATAFAGDLAAGLATYIVAVRARGARVPVWLTVVLAAATATIAISLAGTALWAARNPVEWDFACFWLYGHAAAAHANVYAPASYAALPLPMSVDADFQREAIGVGFPYPPPSILLFLPLGLATNFTIASALWIALLLVVLAAAAALVWRADARADDVPFALAVVALALALPAVNDTLIAHQTNFIAFAFLAGAYLWRRGYGGGVAAALAAIVKPYLLIVIVWFALRRRWNALLAAAVTLGLTCLISLPFLGPDGLRTYVVDNPSARMPGFVFAEAATASLYAFLVRIEHRAPSAGGALHDPLFLALAIVLLAATTLLVLRARTADDDVSLGLCVALALMLYYGTGTMYAVALVPALIALGRRAGTRYAVACGLFAAAFAFANGHGGAATFLAYAALWAALALVSIGAAKRGVQTGTAP
jgi:hypothetical protein